MVPDPNLLLSDLLQSQKLMMMQPIKNRKSFFIEKCYLHNYSKLLITEAITKHENNQKSVDEPDKYKKFGFYKQIPTEPFVSYECLDLNRHIYEPIKSLPLSEPF